jgi:hypothetical protein
MANEQLDSEGLEKALRSAFSLGQTYWDQADSEALSQQIKSGKTLIKFHKLLAECLSKFEEGR